MLEWRLKAFRHWLTMTEPHWPMCTIRRSTTRDIIYYSAPKSKKAGNKSLDEVDPELLATYEKLGIPLDERAALAGVAVDAVFDSVSVKTTFKEKLAELGIIFCSFSRSGAEHPELSEEIPRARWCHTPITSSPRSTRRFSATARSAIFPRACAARWSFRPTSASTPNTGQFERTLIVADEGAYVSYLEGCTAPMRDENQLHAAVVELIALDDAQIKYSTVQNWYPGDKEGKGGIYNFVTKRGACRGVNSKISWTQVETGSAITWKYPSCILQGDNSVGEFYSVAVTNNYQQADTGTKMIHIGKNTKSTSFRKASRPARPEHLSRPGEDHEGRGKRAQLLAVRFLLMGDKCGAHTFPYLEVKTHRKVEHEATTSKIGEDQLFYCRQRGIRRKTPFR
jgi:Fe-S cluster assembly protein SufB